MIAIRPALLGIGLCIGCGGAVEASPVDAGTSDSTIDATKAVDATDAWDGAVPDTGAPSDVTIVIDSSDTSEVASAPVGCPPTQPKDMQPCGEGPYYCFYYVSDTCPNAFKCTSGGGPPYAFYGFGPNCKVPDVSACTEGKDCGGFEKNGGCVVPCNRYCHCGAGTLVCKTISC